MSEGALVITLTVVYLAGYFVTMLINCFLQIRKSRQKTGYGKIYDHEEAFLVPILWFIFLLMAIIDTIWKGVTIVLEYTMNKLLAATEKSNPITIGDKDEL